MPCFSLPRLYQELSSTLSQLSDRSPVANLELLGKAQEGQGRFPTVTAVIWMCHGESMGFAGCCFPKGQLGACRTILFLLQRGSQLCNGCGSCRSFGGDLWTSWWGHGHAVLPKGDQNVVSLLLHMPCAAPTAGDGPMDNKGTGSRVGAQLQRWVSTLLPIYIYIKV